MHVMNFTRVRVPTLPISRVSWYPSAICTCSCHMLDIRTERHDMNKLKKDVMSIRTDPTIGDTASSRCFFPFFPLLKKFNSCLASVASSHQSETMFERLSFSVGARCFQSSSVSDGRLTALFGFPLLLLRSIYKYMELSDRGSVETCHTPCPTTLLDFPAANVFRSTKAVDSLTELADWVFLCYIPPTTSTMESKNPKIQK